MGTAICIIPARGGSKRLPRKNLMLFNGKPMLWHAIDTARESRCFSDIIVSTDDMDIAKLAANRGARFSKRLWHDPDGAVGTQEVTRQTLHQECISTKKYVCCLYPTTPLLKPEHLHHGMLEAKKSGVHFAMGAGAHPLRDAGAFYWGRAKHFALGFPLLSIHTRLIILPEQNVCDINTQADWDEALGKYREIHKK
jgi:CMP-N-acetylneuraminic acid synthetase